MRVQRTTEYNTNSVHYYATQLDKYADQCEADIAEQANRINGLDAMLRQARVWSEEKDKRIEKLETALEWIQDNAVSPTPRTALYKKARAALATHEGANKSHPNAQPGQAEGGDVTR